MVRQFRKTISSLCHRELSSWDDHPAVRDALIGGVGPTRTIHQGLGVPLTKSEVTDPLVVAKQDVEWGIGPEFRQRTAAPQPPLGARFTVADQDGTTTAHSMSQG
jgi:hypothetical protein